MAGIGWKLERLVEHGSVTGPAQAYLTGMAVTNAPWLLTAAVMGVLHQVAGPGESNNVEAASQLIMLAYAITVVFSAPIHVVVSRLVADKLYEKHPEAIAAPLRRALAGIMLLFAAMAAGLMVLVDPPATLMVPAVTLMSVLGGQWLLVSVGGGLVPPTVVLRAFAGGAVLGLVAAWVLHGPASLQGLGYLLGFTVGPVFTFLWMHHAVITALPQQEDERSPLLPAFSNYRVLALSALFFQASTWLDKVLVWLLAGKEEAFNYACISTLAWCTAIPAFGWVYVQVETVFYNRFHAFYSSMEAGATLSMLRELEGWLQDETVRVVWGAARVQACVAVVSLVLAPALLQIMDVPLRHVEMFQVLVVGAALLVLTLCVVLLLSYFDLRREALMTSASLMCLEVVGTWMCWAGEWCWAFGHVMACGVAFACGMSLLHKRLTYLLVDTFQSQPCV